MFASLPSARAAARPRAAVPRRVRAVGLARVSHSPRLSIALATPATTTTTTSAPPTTTSSIIADRDWPDAGVSARATARPDGGVDVIITPSSTLPATTTLHWSTEGWATPDESVWPAGTAAADGGAVRTPLTAPLCITFPAPPPSLVFVLDLGSGTWAHAPGGGDFVVRLAPPSAAGVLARAVATERGGKATLFERFAAVAGCVDDAAAAGAPGVGVLAAWLRLSSLKLLPWYGGGACHQPKDVAGVQRAVTERVARLAATADDGDAAVLARIALACLPRGGGAGDDVRHGILNIMREFGIREGHRPGIDEPFLEQWHQKLHTNTTPDDVTICEAYLAFLDTGSEQAYNDTLWHRGRLTRADMAAWPRPVAATPLHLPHLKGAFDHYLRTLKSTHSGADLDAAADAASRSLPPDLAWHVNDLRANRGAWWAPGKVADIRAWLRPVWTAPGAPRDAALLDVALDAFLRTRIEADAANPGLSQGDRAGMVATLLRSAALDAPPGGDVAQCATLWSKLANDMAAGTDVDPRLVLAAAQRTELALAAAADAAVAAVQPAAAAIGAAAGIDDVHVATFGEETARGTPLAAAGGLLAALAAAARTAAGGGAWTVVAAPKAGVAVGTVIELAALGDAAGETYPTGAILVCGAVDGSEDVPPGAAAVLTPVSVDALAHLSLRARAQGTLLATAHDAAALDGVRALAGAVATAAVAPGGDVVVSAGGAVGATSPTAAPPRLVLVQPPPPSAWVVTEDEYVSSKCVGAKSLNLATLRGGLAAVRAAAGGAKVDIPASVALPFGTLDRVLADPANAAAAAAVAKLRAAVEKAAAEPTGLPAAELAELRATVGGALAPPPGLRAALAAAASTAGVVPAGTWADDADPAWGAAWAGICGVWASAWTDRAWLARRSARVPDAALSMAVLVQAVAPAAHAFVLHSADPTAVGGVDDECVYGEVVAGAGEALVSAAPGRAAAFRAVKNAGATATITTLTLPSKRAVWRVPPAGAVIFRSDSNGEDLADFAGAGLHDSICVPSLHVTTTDLASEPLAWDPAARDALFGKLAAVAAAVEAAAGGAPQDVEGCVLAGGDVVIVQARPQVI